MNHDAMWPGQIRRDGHGNFWICTDQPKTITRWNRVTGRGRKQPVYRGAEHVGWLMPTRGDNGVTLADLPALREIAAALPVTELDHPMTTAARLLLWERGRKEK